MSAPGGPRLSQQAAADPAPVDLPQHGAGRQRGEVGGHVGEEVEGVP